VAKSKSPIDTLSLPEAKILLEVARKVADGQTLDDQLEILVALVTEATGADRGTLFVNDPATEELYSRVTVGGLKREIRILNNTGIAGHVFQSGKGLLVKDVYKDSRFNRSVDEQTGYRTRSIACAPIRTVRGELIGVVEVLNRKGNKTAHFTPKDLKLLEAMAMQSSVSLQRSLLLELGEKEKAKEAEFLGVVSEISGEIQLGNLLAKIIRTITRLLHAERSTLFINDEKTNELYTEVGEGLGATQIRFPNHLGIAGAVFTSGQTVNIQHAYADLRFNPGFDKKTGFFTRSILCTPVINKAGKVIGATQVLNKRGGAFTHEDEAKLKAFTAQVSVALENAKLFDDVQNMKNYAESMLESMSNAVVTLNEDGVIQTCNAPGYKILKTSGKEILKKKAAEFFTGKNVWIEEKIRQVAESKEPALVMDAEMEVAGEKVSANFNVLPLISVKGKPMGTMLMIEDISDEKRMKGTMARYMDPAIADQLMATGKEVLGGNLSEASILFSDVRSFTTLTESLGAQGTVGLLNEYFTLMVDCLQKEGGMLDKFIGDAIMAVFGLPLAREDDADRSVRAGIGMLRELDAFNRARKERGMMAIDMGLGINTDEIVSGNIGSPKRMNYTVIGDGVNLAARLETACKQYGAKMLVSDATVKKLKGTYRMRETDRVVVKGKTEPVVIFECLDYHTDETFPNPMEVINQFKDGLAKYRKQEWEKAKAAFQEALKANPGDKLSKIYIERCLHFQKEPPGDKWDGVWVMKEK
jgi:adenylate cyclase